MTHQPRTQAAPPQISYKTGDFVLYRNAELFWTGKPGHTFVCRVERSWRRGGTGSVRYDLVDLTNQRNIAGIDPAYMRLLPKTDVMHDIDTAPLSEPDTGAMTPAAVAWLRQHLGQDSSALPAGH